MSSSKASTQANTSQSSTTKDNRIASAEDSINLTDSNGNAINVTSNVTSIDAGAVGKSFDFAESVTKGAASVAAASVGDMADLSVGAIDAVRDAYRDSAKVNSDNSKMAISAITSANANTNEEIASAYKGVTSALADAWQSSKAGEQKLLAFGVMAVLGIVAFRSFGGKG